MLLSSCSNLEKKRQVVSAIEQWIGKELLYPNSTIFTIQGVDTLDNAFLEEYSYTIVSYVDSIGCTSCKLQLNRWNIFMQEVDSISKKEKFLLIVSLCSCHLYWYEDNGYNHIDPIFRRVRGADLSWWRDFPHQGFRCLLGGGQDRVLPGVCRKTVTMFASD